MYVSPLVLSRFKQLHGRQLVHPFLERKLKIITDSTLVDMTFGAPTLNIYTRYISVVWSSFIYACVRVWLTVITDSTLVDMTFGAPTLNRIRSFPIL